MRNYIRNRARPALLAALTLACLAPAASAQKVNRKPGGGGQDPPPPPPMPAVSYEVAPVVPVAGLIRLWDVNDDGLCAVTVRISEVADPINTNFEQAAAILDPATGQVAYLDNLIDPNEPWDLYSPAAINDRGQILGIGWKDGDPFVKAFLLTPGANGYDLTDVGLDGLHSTPVSLTDSGDVLVRTWDGQSSFEEFFARLDDGTLIPLPAGDRFYYELNARGILIGTHIGNYFDSLFNLSGVEISLERLPGSGVAALYDLADTGFSVGVQNVGDRKIKGKIVSGLRVVTHDEVGHVTEVPLPPCTFNAWMRINEQEVGGEPMIAGVTYSPTDDFWVRFPGFDALFLTDLMDPVQQQAFARLNFGYPILGESNPSFRMTTPRDPDGEVDHAGAPTFIGEAYRRENAQGEPGFEGIYIIRPVPAP